MEVGESVIDIPDSSDEFDNEVNKHKLYFDELPFHEVIVYDNVSSGSKTDFNDEQPRPSSSTTNDDDMHDSGITSSSSRNSDRPISSENINYVYLIRESKEGELPIPLQVVALAEGFGLGDFIYDENDHASRVHQDGTDVHGYDYDNEHDMMTCLVCFEAFAGKKVLHCYECDLHICLTCMCNHIESKISDGVIRLYCAGESCSRLLSDQMISAFCPESMPIFIKNRIEVENNPLKKTCPNCHRVEVISDLNDLSQRQIKCVACSLLWCHHCYTPWHSGLSCQVYQKDVVGVGKKALKFWAKSKGKHTANARKCPSCHFYIERISGCDHMTCNRCNTDFCYKCGSKHRSFGWFGNHYSTYSFLGCKYNLLPKKPVLRIMVRSSAFCGVVLGAPVAAFLVVTGALCILAVSPILIPIIIHKRCKSG